MKTKDTKPQRNHSNCHLSIATPIGKLAVVYQPKPFAIRAVVLPQTDREQVDSLVEIYGASDSSSHRQAAVIQQQIIDYFNGNPIHPPWQWLDMSGLTRLQASVLTATADIPYGKLKSYQDIAVAVQRPRAYRFVGSTLAKNPFPILIPCHRVIRSDSTFGQFGGGTDMKRKLIEMEAAFAKKLKTKPR